MNIQDYYVDWWMFFFIFVLSRGFYRQAAFDCLALIFAFTKMKPIKTLTNISALKSISFPLIYNVLFNLFRLVIEYFLYPFKLLILPQILYPIMFKLFLKSLKIPISL